jgi:aryl-alcohol dehydrogenase-like predicted oxidoreductase
MLSRSAEADILPYCRDNNIGVLLRGPISQGLLADKFSEDTRFEDTVRQKWNPDGAQRQDFLDKLGKVAELRKLVPPGTNMAEMALRFTLAHPAVTCPIPGMKTPDQARANAAAADGELSDDLLRKIDGILPPAGSR